MHYHLKSYENYMRNKVWSVSRARERAPGKRKLRQLSKNIFLGILFPPLGTRTVF